MTVAEYIISFLESKQVDACFMVPGGQAMFLNDAIFRSKIKPVFFHHEQAAGMAAEAYGRISGKLGFAMVTAGPASMNILNAVMGAWVDSSPMMVIAGQSPWETVKYMRQHDIRQAGLQGVWIAPIVETFVKSQVTMGGMDLKETLNEMYRIALEDRKGPVWITVPLDIQNVELN